MVCKGIDFYYYSANGFNIFLKHKNERTKHQPDKAIAQAPKHVLKLCLF